MENVDKLTPVNSVLY